MKQFVKRMIEEHSQLCVRISKLHNYVYSSLSDNDDKVEFANKAIQLAAMKKYEEALYARLSNQGIHMEDGKYFEQIAELTTSESVAANCNVTNGGDFDADKAEQNGQDIDFGDN